MVKIYTKTGDKGETGLFGGKRVLKSDVQVQAYGAVDELSSVLGVVMTTQINSNDQKLITTIQQNLYHVMVGLSGGSLMEDVLKGHTREVEKYIDTLEKDLEPLHRFLLPQGTQESVWFHMARTICRRAERQVVAWTHEQKNMQHDALISYLNRLSDLFFVMSRSYNKGQEVST